MFKYVSTSMFFVIFTMCSPILAEVHKWVDEQGKVHYGDRPPESANVQYMEVSVESFSSVEVRELNSDDLSLLSKGEKEKIKQKKVVMYSTENCGYCKKAKSYFNAKQISYSERDINKDQSARRQWEKLNGTGVPLIIIGESKMSGFSAERFESIYFN